jgi:hypothetical protein
MGIESQKRHKVLWSLELVGCKWIFKKKGKPPSINSIRICIILRLCPPTPLHESGLFYFTLVRNTGGPIRRIDILEKSSPIMTDDLKLRFPAMDRIFRAYRC